MRSPSHTAPHLNFSITYKRSVEFQMEIKIICRRGFGLQTTQFVVISRCFFAWEAEKCIKFSNARAALLFCQLNLLFFHVLVAVAVVVCLRSLIRTNDRMSKQQLMGGIK